EQDGAHLRGRRFRAGGAADGAHQQARDEGDDGENDRRPREARRLPHLADQHRVVEARLHPARPFVTSRKMPSSSARSGSTPTTWAPATTRARTSSATNRSSPPWATERKPPAPASTVATPGISRMAFR